MGPENERAERSLILGVGLEQLDIWACHLLIRRRLRRSRSRGKQEFWFNRVKFEMPARYPNGDVQ